MNRAGRLTNHIVGGQTRRFAYNYRGQMTALHNQDGRVFAYDFDGDPAGGGAGGNRIRQSLNDCLETRFVYDGPNVVLELTASPAPSGASNEVATAYINGLGIDQPIERIGFISAQPRFRHVFHADALGSIVALTDESGTTTKTYAYEAFGRIRVETGDAPLNRITYTAREALGDSGGWYFYRNRVVDPSVGRFSSGDPVGFADGGNIYIYVYNQPVVYIDPSGLSGFPGLFPDGPFPSPPPPHNWHGAITKRPYPPVRYSSPGSCMADCIGYGGPIPPIKVQINVPPPPSFAIPDFPSSPPLVDDITDMIGGVVGKVGRAVGRFAKIITGLPLASCICDCLDAIRGNDCDCYGEY